FQTMLVLQNQERAGIDLPGVTSRDRSGHTGISKFDLTFSLTENRESADRTAPAQGIGGYLEYATDLFDEATARALCDRFARVLTEAVEHPDRAVGDLDPLGPGERDRLLAQGHGTARPLPTATAPEAVRLWASRTPGATAVR
ncbi:condensation domain-containing protein, partial [Streptomyces sp. SID4982]|uniref:condensation domain-containing protein n=2 Tax=unclassified Streptomyces TaxID=2593676 RepID=UPI00136CB515